MRILIVGAGLAGLYQAYSLLQKNHEIVILEKTPKLGGLLRTLRYEDNGDTYLFDIGPHRPPENDALWNQLCKKVETVNITHPNKMILKLKNSEIVYPFSLNSLNIIEMISLLKFTPSFLYSVINKKTENNFENVLINIFGRGLYDAYIKSFVSNFWEVDPKFISKDFNEAVKTAKFKLIIQRFLRSLTHNVDDSSYPPFKYPPSPQPKFGIAGLLKPLINEINRHQVQIKTNSIIKKIDLRNNSMYTEIEDLNGQYKDKFDKIIWSGSLSDLSHILGLSQYYKLKYRALLIINCTIYKEDLLGENIDRFYIMIPNTIFHRVYEPKKFSPAMAPKSTTSICIEVTLRNKPQNLQLLIKKCLKQFCHIFSLSESQIKYLGCHFIENVYPFLFINYQNYLKNFYKTLNYRFKNKFFLIGRSGQYSYYNIEETLNSVRRSEVNQYLM